MTIERASDNPFPSILIEESTEPTAPAAGHQRLYIDSTTHLLKLTNSSGTDSNVGGGLSDPMTTRGDVIVRNASNVTARLAIGSSGKVLSSDGTDISWQTPAAGGISAGTSFPGSPATNDMYFRTDRKLLYFYDGTRWRTVNEYTLPTQPVQLQGGLSATGEVWRAGIDGTYDAYVTSAEFSAQVVTTNSGSHFWTLTVKKYTPASAATTIATQSTASDTPSNWVYHTVAVGAVVDRTTHTMIGFDVTKSGSPGAVYPNATVKYQLVG